MRLSIGTLALTLIVVAQTSVAQENTRSYPAWLDRLELSGFGDMLLQLNGPEGESPFRLNQFELDLAAQISPKVNLSIALATDGTSFTLATAMAEYLMLDRSEAVGSAFSPNELVIGGGRFDVMFGIDHRCYASIDRKIVSSPLSVTHIHDQWNDVGLFARVNAPLWDLAIYAVNGQICHLAALDGDTISPDWSVGSQAGISPIKSLRLGGSYAFSYHPERANQAYLFGLDIKYESGGLELVAEYLAHKLQRSDAGHYHDSGFYSRGSYSLGDWFAIARYGEYRSCHGECKLLTRFSSGIGRVLTEGIELRTEYQSNNRSNNTAYVQFLVGF